MRFEPSVAGIPRKPTEPIVVGDEAVPAGSLLILSTAAANREIGVWPEPDTFDITRFAEPGVPRLMSFGIGTHYCLGAALARMTLEEAVRALFVQEPQPRAAADLSDRHLAPSARPEPGFTSRNGWCVMPERLAGRRVVVIGAGTRRSDDPDAPIGNGRAISVLAAREGASVACVDRDADAAGETARLVEEAGGTAYVVVGDVSDEQESARVVDESIAVLGGIDGLVCNVGIGEGRGLEGTSAAEWDAVFAVNVRAHFLLCRAALPRLAESGADRVRVVGCGSAPGHADPRVRHVEGGAGRTVPSRRVRRLARGRARERGRARGSSTRRWAGGRRRVARAGAGSRCRSAGRGARGRSRRRSYSC